MYRTDALAWASPPPPAFPTPSATGEYPAAARTKRIPNERWGGPIVDFVVMVAAGATMALMVLVGGYIIGQTAPRATATAVTMSSITSDIDPRDSAVANGLVTPWMERARAAEPPRTP